eukprot:349754-Chlamydomonas_euryale.AAC.8
MGTKAIARVDNEVELSIGIRGLPSRRVCGKGNSTSALGKNSQPYSARDALTAARRQADWPKTAIIAAGQAMPLPTLQLSLAKSCWSFIVYGPSTRAFLVEDRSMGREMHVQNVRALLAFRRFQDIWASPKPSMKRKWMVIALSFCQFLAQMTNVDAWFRWADWR